MSRLLRQMCILFIFFPLRFASLKFQNKMKMLKVGDDNTILFFPLMGFAGLMFQNKIKMLKVGEDDNSVLLFQHVCCCSPCLTSICHTGPSVFLECFYWVYLTKPLQQHDFNGNPALTRQIVANPLLSSRHSPRLQTFSHLYVSSGF
jgi:hypothetical protein